MTSLKIVNMPRSKVVIVGSNLINFIKNHNSNFTGYIVPYKVGSFAVFISSSINLMLHSWTPTKYSYPYIEKVDRYA